MPEGPSIVILKEEAQQFEGKKVIEVDGNSSADINRMRGLAITEFRSWGKHFLICFPNFFVRIHFLLFGTYRVNERKDSKIRLGLRFHDGELNFYACSVKVFEGNSDSHYDFTADVMNDKWNPKQACSKSIQPVSLPSL